MSEGDGAKASTTEAGMMSRLSATLQAQVRHSLNSLKGGLYRGLYRGLP